MVGALLEPILWSEGIKAGKREGEERTAVTLCAKPPISGDTVFTQVTIPLAPPGSCQDDERPNMLESGVDLLIYLILSKVRTDTQLCPIIRLLFEGEKKYGL